MIKQRTIMKYISTLIVALLPAVSLNAQTVTPLEQQVETDSLTINTEVNVVMPEIDTYPFFGHRSRLSFSVGSGSGHVMALAIGNAAVTGLREALFGKPGNNTDYRSTGLYNLSYRYLAPKKNRWAFGVNFSYVHVFDKNSGNASTSEYKFDCFYLTFSVLAYYKKTGSTRLYAAGDIGLIMINGFPWIADNFTPIGVEFGNGRVAGFAELNLGFKAFINLGVRVGL